MNALKKYYGFKQWFIHFKFFKIFEKVKRCDIKLFLKNKELLTVLHPVTVLPFEDFAHAFKSKIIYFVVGLDNSVG